MSLRLAKQIIYGAFYVVVWVFVIWIGYALFVHPAPPAPPAITATAQPVNVLSVNAFASTPGNETLLAKVANANADLAAQYFTFSFDLHDASGAVIASLPGASFLYGSEVKYVLLVNQPVPNAMGVLNTMDDGSGTAVSLVNAWTLTIPTSTTEWVTTSSFGSAPDFAIQNVSTQISTSTTDSASSSDSSDLALVTGTLTDNDTATFNNIFIVAVYKDANGNPIGASQTELDSIVPNQTENFSVSYPAVAGIDPAATEVEAYAER